MKTISNAPVILPLFVALEIFGAGCAVEGGGAPEETRAISQLLATPNTWLPGHGLDSLPLGVDSDGAPLYGCVTTFPDGSGGGGGQDPGQLVCMRV
jgi:hypothetical protein